MQHSFPEIHNTHAQAPPTLTHTHMDYPVNHPHLHAIRAQNRKEGEEAALHSQAGNKEKEKQPEPGIYGGKNNGHPKIPQDHLRR